MGNNGNLRVTQDEAERRKVHEYRVGVREWLYAYAKREEELGKWPRLVTFTLKDTTHFGSVISNDDPDFIVKAVLQAAREAAGGLRGFLVVEAGRRTGRLHGHALLWGSVEPVVTHWRRRRGFAVVSDVSDMLGAVHYVTKALGPESRYTMLDGGGEQGELLPVRKAGPLGEPVLPASSGGPSGAIDVSASGGPNGSASLPW